MVKHYHAVLILNVALAYQLIEQAQAGDDTTLPVFLFAGQSNMLGHPNEAGNQHTNAKCESARSRSYMEHVVTSIDRLVDNRGTKTNAVTNTNQQSTNFRSRRDPSIVHGDGTDRHEQSLRRQ